MKNTRALVTLALGDKFERVFEQTCRDSWQTYCDHNSYDLVVLKQPLDTTPRAMGRSPAWQKLLILSQDWSDEYDQIVWVDTDVFINLQSAKDIVSQVPKHLVGAVDAYSIPTREIHDISLRRLYEYWDESGSRYINNPTPADYYEKRGLPGRDLEAVAQTGIFVCSPAHHKEVLEHIYYKYEDQNGPAWNYETPPMSFELIKRNLIHWLPPQFNFCVSAVTSAFYPFTFNRDSVRSTARRLGVLQSLSKAERLALLNIHDLGYFIHFAGCSNLMRPLHAALSKRQAISGSERISTLTAAIAYLKRLRRNTDPQEG